jgi:ribosomal protein L35
MKTNKSYVKRLKITKSGKLIARRPGQNHFNAKESRVDRLSHKQTRLLKLSNKARSRFLLGDC